LRQHRPLAQHDHPVTEPGNGVHDMLDDDDGNAAITHLSHLFHQRLDLARHQSCHNLVQQQQNWVHRESPRQLDALAIDYVEAIGRLVSL
jgi:hypothetical protein